jgi:GWxTD domain-containing protein
LVISEKDSVYGETQKEAYHRRVKKVIEVYREIVQENADDADVHHRLACLYLILNTVDNRQRARWAIEKAVRLDPDKVAYQLTFGKLLWSQMFWYNGNAHYEKMIEVFPDDLQATAIARYWMGYYALQGFLAYQDRLIMGNEGFAEGDRVKAIALFKRSIADDSDFRDPYYHLGLVYLESNQPDSMIFYARKLLRHHPNDAHVFLFCGLGYQSLGDQEKAYTFYATALDMLPPKERETIESIEYLGNEEGSKVHSGDGLVDLDRFWRQKDPLLLTAFNESRMDHYRRMAYANLRFSRVMRGIPGWQTDQGKTYIKFGPYLSRTVLERRETWHYGDFRIHFRRGADLDAWYFEGEELDEAAASLAAGYWPDHGRAHFQKQAPKFHDPYREQKYSVPYQVSAFSMKDSVRLEVAYAIPVGKVDVTKGARITDGLFLFDARWDSLYRQVAKTYVFDYETHKTPEGLFWISQHQLMLPLGTYQVTAEVGDYEEGAIGTFRMVKEAAPADTVLAMSDPLLASRIDMRKPYPESRDDLAIVQNPLRTFRQSEYLHLYFEVYRLNRDVFGRTHYDVSYRVQWPEKEKVDASLFLALDKPDAQLFIEESELAPDGFRDYQVQYVLPDQAHLIQKADKNRTETEVTVSYEGDRDTEFIFLNIDLHQVPVGIHQLQVTVHHAGQRISRDVLFRVVE